MVVRDYAGAPFLPAGSGEGAGCGGYIALYLVIILIDTYDPVVVPGIGLEVLERTAEFVEDGIFVEILPVGLLGIDAVVNSAERQF